MSASRHRAGQELVDQNPPALNRVDPAVRKALDAQTVGSTKRLEMEGGFIGKLKARLPPGGRNRQIRHLACSFECAPRPRAATSYRAGSDLQFISHFGVPFPCIVPRRPAILRRRMMPRR